MELFDFDELPAALLTVHPLLQPLVPLQMEKMEKSTDFTLLRLTDCGGWGEGALNPSPFKVG